MTQSQLENHAAWGDNTHGYLLQRNLAVTRRVRASPGDGLATLALNASGLINVHEPPKTTHAHDLSITYLVGHRKVRI
jgi:hypothetical protein